MTDINEQLADIFEQDMRCREMDDYDNCPPLVRKALAEHGSCASTAYYFIKYRNRSEQDVAHWIKEGYWP